MCAEKDGWIGWVCPNCSRYWVNVITSRPAPGHRPERWAISCPECGSAGLVTGKPGEEILTVRTLAKPLG